MSSFGTLSIPKVLERQRDALDQAFGVGAYSIESTDAAEATVRSGLLEWRVGYDSRDRSIHSLIVESGVPEAGQAIPETWARYLGEEPTGWPKDSSGHVSLSLDEQVRIEIERLARLKREIFSDPQRARDAAYFVRGYHSAYNDWASGNWD
jgi:hypothetical protein